MSAIDIGAAAIDRATISGDGGTYVHKDNPANDTGSITSIEIWAYSNLSNCEVATFYVVSGNNLSTRDSETIGSVTAGSKQTFSGLSMDVQTGDYIGIYWTNNASLERDDSGGAGYWYEGGDQIPCTNKLFSTVNTVRAQSLYGIGATPSVTAKTSSDTGSGADAIVVGNPLATLTGFEAGAGVDVFAALLSALVQSETGSGADAVYSLETPEAKSSSDAGSGVEGTPVPSAVLAGSETGSGVEALIARLLAALDTGGGAEASSIEIEGLLKALFASELGQGGDCLVAKIEMPTKGGGMKLWT
jgi:hypothetical protein